MLKELYQQDNGQQVGDVCDGVQKKQNKFYFHSNKQSEFEEPNKALNGNSAKEN